MIPAGSFLAFRATDLKKELRHMIAQFQERDGGSPQVILCPPDEVAAVEAVIGHEWPLVVHAFRIPKQNYWLGIAPPFASAVPPAVQEAVARQQLRMGLFDEG